MKKRISYKDACKINKTFDDIDPSKNELFVAASKRDDCFICKETSTSPVSLNIVAKSQALGNKFTGFLICLYRHDISIYACSIDGDEITDDMHICNAPLNTPLDKLIEKAETALGICPVCGKPTPFTEQKRYSFAGRCCNDCLPEMKRKHEYPGWYN